MLPFRKRSNREGPPTVKQKMRKHRCEEPAGTDAVIDAVPLQPPKPHLPLSFPLCVSPLLTRTFLSHSCVEQSPPEMQR